MFSFKGFFTQEKNTHLEHLEDDIINRGSKVGEFTKADVDFYEKEQSRLQRYTIAGNKINFGKVKWSTSFAKARKLEVENNRTASQLSTKLQCFQWLENMNEMQKKGVLNEFLNVAYYGAKKQYASAGPFLKIS